MELAGQANQPLADQNIVHQANAARTIDHQRDNRLGKYDIGS
jgi:hypothetical protein